MVSRAGLGADTGAENAQVIDFTRGIESMEDTELLESGTYPVHGSFWNQTAVGFATLSFRLG